MYKVSVIMPIYNAEKYLENAINSVINQTIGFENIELILVDDCSTDNSRNIVEEYSNNYPNIKKIFLEKNTGCPGIPRNIGIKNATSDYIMFIDNDDEYLPEICDKLYNTLIREDADVVACNYLDTVNGEDINYSCSSDEVMLGSDIIYFAMVLIWNCIFKKSIILDNDISFIDGINEDAVFTLEYHMYSQKLVYLKNFVGYHHQLRDDSLSIHSFDVMMGVLKSYFIMFEVLDEGGRSQNDIDMFFKNKIQGAITNGTIYCNKNEIKKLLSELCVFEKKINFTGNLPILFRFINFFILHGNINIATYICLFISKIRKSNFLLNIHRKFFLN